MYIYSSVLHTVLLYPVYVVASTATWATCKTADILAPTHSFRYFKLCVRLCVSQQHELSASSEGNRTAWHTARDNGFKKCIAFCVFVCVCENTACVRGYCHKHWLFNIHPRALSKLEGQPTALCCHPSARTVGITASSPLMSSPLHHQNRDYKVDLIRIKVCRELQRFNDICSPQPAEFWHQGNYRSAAIRYVCEYERTKLLETHFK